MYGAIIGDTIGSVYEFDNIKTKDFPLFIGRSRCTDDSVMTVAVAKALLDAREQDIPLRAAVIQAMRAYGQAYPYAGYGGRFSRWLVSQNPTPYNSFGNGSAMRVSPCGLIARSLEEALELAQAVTDVTHNHPEGIKGAKATAAAVYLAKAGKSKEAIRSYIEQHFYMLDKTLDEIRPTYRFTEACQDTVPQALTAFFEADSFEEAIRNAISIGGDSDTVAAITGAVAWSYYRHDCRATEESLLAMEAIREETAKRLPSVFLKVIEAFEAACR